MPFNENQADAMTGLRAGFDKTLILKPLES